MKELILARVTRTPLIKSDKGAKQDAQDRRDLPGQALLRDEPVGQDLGDAEDRGDRQIEIVGGERDHHRQRHHRIDRPAVHHRLKGKGGEKCVALEEREDDDQQDEKDRQVPHGEEARGAGSKIALPVVVAVMLASP